MELIGAILVAGPLGYLARSGRLGLGLYLLVWVTVFPIQSAVVHAENADDINVAYFVVNVVILLLGVGLNRFGAIIRQRRAAKRAAPATAA